MNYNQDTKMVKIYIDGVLNKEEILHSDITQFITSYLQIGASLNSLDQYFGDMDDLRIYNRALNEAEIKELYKLGQPKATNIYEDNFDTLESFENNWTQKTSDGCCGAGNPATYTVENGKLILTTDGGSDGYMGIGDGSYFVPNNLKLKGNFVLEVSAKELLREKTDGYKDNSGFGIYLATSDSLDKSVVDIGIGGNYSGYFEGYNYNEYNAHRISAYNPIIQKHIFVDEYDLNALYDVKFKIQREENHFTISYKLDNAQTWIEHQVDIDTNNELIPILRVGSGDGGGTRKNGRFSTEVDYLRVGK